MIEGRHAGMTVAPEAVQCSFGGCLYSLCRNFKNVEEKEIFTEKVPRSHTLDGLTEIHVHSKIDCNHRRSLPNCVWIENGGGSMGTGT